MVTPRNAVAFVIIHPQISERETVKIILVSPTSILGTYFSLDYENIPFLSSFDRLFCTYTLSTQSTLQVTLSLNRCTSSMDGYSILREKSLAIYFGDSQFRRNMTFNFIVSNIYAVKRWRIR